MDVSGRNNGLVLKFMGDGAVIGFGLPDTRPNDEENAMRCAFAPTLEARAWFAGTGLSGEANTVQVGAPSGPVALSHLGHEDQQQITVTGDCVNVASWLMEVGKGFEAAVTASTTLTDTGQLTFAELALAPHIKTVSIRGRQEAMMVGVWTAADIAALTPLTHTS